METLFAVLFLFILLSGGGYFLAIQLGNWIFREKEPTHKTVINNYKIENHLHISKKDLNDLLNDNSAEISNEQ